jgi:hypothetical protein
MLECAVQSVCCDVRVGCTCILLLLPHYYYYHTTTTAMLQRKQQNPGASSPAH